MRITKGLDPFKMISAAEAYEVAKAKGALSENREDARWCGFYEYKGQYLWDDKYFLEFRHESNNRIVTVELSTQIEPVKPKKKWQPDLAMYRRLIDEMEKDLNQ